MKKVKGIVEALLAHVRKNFGLRWEKNSNKTANVLLVDFNACVRQVYLKTKVFEYFSEEHLKSCFSYVVQLWRRVSWADVWLTAEGRDSNRVVIECGKIVREGPVHVTDSMEFRWKDAREDGDKTGTHQCVEKVLAAVELWNDHVFAIVDSCQRDVEPSVHPDVGVIGQIAHEAIEQASLNVEGGRKRSERVGTGLVHDPEEVGCQFTCKMKRKIWDFLWRIMALLFIRMWVSMMGH